MTTVIHEQRETAISDSRGKGDSLWCSFANLERATGWTLKPEGLCQGDICLPLHADKRREWQRTEAGTQEIDAAALWRSLGHPVVRDATGDIWVLGTGAGERASRLQSLEAPDFILPDLAGRQHSLSEFRGKKVFLSTWASW